MNRGYDYKHSGSEDGLRRDIRRQRWAVVLMVLLGGAAVALLVYLSLAQ